MQQTQKQINLEIIARQQAKRQEKDILYHKKTKLCNKIQHFLLHFEKFFV